MDGQDQVRRPRRLAIYGSCVSRDAVPYLDSEDWTLTAYHARQSAAVLALPYQRPDLDLRGMPSAFRRRVVTGDLTRSAVWALPHLPADVLLWDLTDERLGVARLPGGHLVTRSVEVTDLGLPAVADAEWIEFGSDEHFDLFRIGTTRLVTALQESGQVQRLVLLDCPFTARVPRAGQRRRRYGPGRGQRRAHGPDDTSQDRPTREVSPERLAWMAGYAVDANAAYRRYVHFVRDVLGVATIHVSARHLALDPEHRWGLAPYHYSASTYRAIARRFTRVAAAPESLLRAPRVGEPARSLVVSVGRDAPHIPQGERVTPPTHPEPAWVVGAAADLAQRAYSQRVARSGVLVAGAGADSGAAFALAGTLGCGAVVLDQPSGDVGKYVDAARTVGACPTVGLVGAGEAPSTSRDLGRALAELRLELLAAGPVIHLDAVGAGAAAGAATSSVVADWERGTGALWDRSWGGQLPLPSAAQPPADAPTQYAGQQLPLTPILTWVRCPSLVTGDIEVAIDIDNPGARTPRAALVSLALTDGSQAVAQAVGAHVSPNDQVGTWRYLSPDPGLSHHEMRFTVPAGVGLAGVGVRSWEQFDLTLVGLHVSSAGAGPSQVEGSVP